jgi:hypothetical protein
MSGRAPARSAPAFADACASLFVDGELAHLEDLVLHDARMDSRAPTAELVRASRVLAARRKMVRRRAGLVSHVLEWSRCRGA